MTIATATAADTPQLALWRSEFGASYTVRNDLERPARVESLRTVLAGLEIAHALEVGCNVGWNLRYLRQVGVPRVWGIEPQRFAVARARAMTRASIGAPSRSASTLPGNRVEPMRACTIAMVLMAPGSARRRGRCSRRSRRPGARAPSARG